MPASGQYEGATQASRVKQRSNQRSGQTSNPVPPAPGKVPGSGGGTNQKAGDGKQFAFAPGYLRLIRRACINSDLVITASTTPFRKCPAGKAEMLRASELARNGTAEIEFMSQSNGLRAPVDYLLGQAQAYEPDGALETHTEATATAPYGAQADSLTRQSTKINGGRTNSKPAREATTVSIRFAVGEPVRPWSRERVYSRAARNMPEFVPAKRTTAKPITPVLTGSNRRGPQ